MHDVGLVVLQAMLSDPSLECDAFVPYGAAMLGIDTLDRIGIGWSGYNRISKEWTRKYAM